jgi:hypothetical protein
MNILIMVLVMTVLSLFVTSATCGCYFPVSQQGEFMTQWLHSSTITYTSLSVLYDSIPGWGTCHSHHGQLIILHQGHHCFRCL